MVRLMLTLTPVVCVLAGIAFSHTYEKYLRDEATNTSSVASGSRKSVHLDENNDLDKTLYDKVRKPLRKT